MNKPKNSLGDQIIRAVIIGIFVVGALIVLGIAVVIVSALSTGNPF